MSTITIHNGMSDQEKLAELERAIAEDNNETTTADTTTAADTTPKYPGGITREKLRYIAEYVAGEWIEGYAAEASTAEKIQAGIVFVADYEKKFMDVYNHWVENGMTGEHFAAIQAHMEADRAAWPHAQSLLSGNDEFEPIPQFVGSEEFFKGEQDYDLPFV